MTDKELIAALRRNMTETGSMVCLGCGHEHNCSTHGCAILREAAERIEQLSAGQSPNPPLTLEELNKVKHELYAMTVAHNKLLSRKPEEGTKWND